MKNDLVNHEYVGLDKTFSGMCELEKSRICTRCCEAATASNNAVVILILQKKTMELLQASFLPFCLNLSFFCYS